MAASNLVKKLILLCAIELGIGAIICYSIPADREGYIAAVQDKKSLLSNSRSPRIIFVGGSNLAFGLDSELVQNELHLPVINLGLHASLGLKTSLNIVEKYAAQDDIIVIIPEYEYFDQSSSMYGSDTILADFIEIDPANLQYVAPGKWIDLPLITFDVLERKLDRESALLLADPVDRDVYLRSNFNRYGDMIGHLGKKPLRPNEISAEAALPTNLNLITTSFDILEEFHQKMINKGVIVLFDFPSLRMRNCKKTSLELFDHLVSALKARTTIPILSTPDERCYPDKYFYNTQYHLNAVGREARTWQVIESLSLMLKK
ncbi:MAG TPA: hypothetical protein VK206_18900 [Anaerolineales bacterium]|nr:hypothetical protein [Anaerolineales bacterium]HLO30494.1 hypothetical protein [Anaerolineales bacterium]